MSITEQYNTAGDLAWSPQPFVVLLGDTAGNPPADTDTHHTGLFCRRVVRSAGGARLDFADLYWPLVSVLANRSQPDQFARMIDIRLVDPGNTFPTHGNTSLHLGDYLQESARGTQAGETLQAQSQVRPWHFGKPVEGYKVYDKIHDNEKLIDEDIVFNPQVDGRVLGNQSSKQFTGGSHFLWAHPETSLTTAGATYQGQSLSEWSLMTAVQSICTLLNENETHIDNPTNYTILTTAPKIRNVRLALGTYLPEALDRLLIPNGFNWYLDPVHDTSNTKPKIVIYEIGAGTEKQIYLQAAGSTLDLAFSNTNDFAISNSIGDAVNHVTVYGAPHAGEITLPLYRAWPSTDDTLNASDLAKDGTQYAGHPYTGRRWCANEAGDFKGTRTEIGDPPDLSVPLLRAVPHRRTISEPLTTFDAAGAEKRPIFIEYSIDAGSNWKPVPSEWSTLLLPDQIGVLFDGNEIPTELWDAGSNGRVRITGTVEGDGRLKGDASPRAGNVNLRTSRVILDLGQKFQRRKVITTGTYASVLGGTPGKADRDDSTAIQTYAEEIRDRSDSAVIDVQFVLPGIHTHYKIGDLITKVEGRELNLNQQSATLTARYPQVIEIHWEWEPEPRTILICDPGFSR